MKDNYVVPESNSVEVATEAIVCSSAKTINASRSDYGEAVSETWGDDEE